MNDILPKQICIRCVTEIYQAYTFTSKCKIVDAALRKCLTNYHNSLNIKQEQEIAEENRVLQESYANETVGVLPIENIETTPDIADDESVEPIAQTEPIIEAVFVKNEPLEDVEVEDESENVDYDEPPGILKEARKHLDHYSHYTSVNNSSSPVQLEISPSPIKSLLNTPQLACDVCGKNFSNLRNLNRHKLLHTGTRPYQCDQCSKSFSEKQSLVIHLRTHTGEKPFACDLCGKRFSILSNMKNHRRIHTGDRRYPCDLCDKRFSQSIHMLTHRGTHTGEQIYKCDMCTRSFARLDRLNRHKSTEHFGLEGNSSS